MRPCGHVKKPFGTNAIILGAILVCVGVVLLLVGALSAGNWVDAQQTDRKFFTLSFFSLVIAPILGGGILMVFGLVEFF